MGRSIAADRFEGNGGQFQISSTQEIVGQRYNGERLYEGGLCVELVCARRGERGEEVNGKVKAELSFWQRGARNNVRGDPALTSQEFRHQSLAQCSVITSVCARMNQ